MKQNFLGYWASALLRLLLQRIKYFPDMKIKSVEKYFTIFNILL